MAIKIRTPGRVECCAISPPTTPDISDEHLGPRHPRTCLNWMLTAWYLCRHSATCRDPQREALVLHDGLGFSVAEVATELSVPEGTVRSWLSRARAVLAPLVSAGDDSTEVIR